MVSLVIAIALLHAAIVSVRGRRLVTTLVAVLTVRVRGVTSSIRVLVVAISATITAEEAIGEATETTTLLESGSLITAVEIGWSLVGHGGLGVSYRDGGADDDQKGHERGLELHSEKKRVLTT